MDKTPDLNRTVYGRQRYHPATFAEMIDDRGDLLEEIGAESGVYFKRARQASVVIPRGVREQMDSPLCKTRRGES